MKAVAVHDAERQQAADAGERQPGEPDPLRPFLVSQESRANRAHDGRHIRDQ
jgi:hypothetical protein